MPYGETGSGVPLGAPEPSNIIESGVLVASRY